MNNETENYKFLYRISIIIAIMYAVCFCKNQTGIACGVFGMFLTFTFWWLKIKKEKKIISIWDIFYGLSSILLSFVPAVSDNVFIIFVSKILLIIIFIKWSIHIRYNVEQIELIRNISVMFDFFFASLSQIFSPFTDIRHRSISGDNSMSVSNNGYKEEYQKKDKKSDFKSQISIGIIISLPFLFVILGLLASADAVFKNMILSVFNGGDNIVNMFEWLLTAAIGFLMAYCLGKVLLQKKIIITPTEINQADTVIGVTFAAIFSVVYVLFCGVQAVALLNTGGNMLPQGYTYARYARAGFFQLLIVCMINVCMVIACRIKFRMNGMLKKLLIVISVCTYIMLVSSAYRIILYIQHYNLTFLRLLVLWSLVVIAVLMIFVIWFIFNNHIKIFEYALLSFTVLFLIFAFMIPENMIAEYNIRNFETEEKTDEHYLLNHLSMDAAGAIISHKFEKENLKVSYCREIVQKYEKSYKNDLRKFNWSRYQAYKRAKKYLESVN